MKILLKIAFFLRLKDKFWGDLFIRWYKMETDKIIDSIDIDVSDIKFVEEKPNPFPKSKFGLYK